MSVRHVLACGLAGLAIAGAISSPIRAEPANMDAATDPFCASFEIVKTQSNAVRGTKVDPATLFLGVDVTCTEKRVQYGQAITIPTARLQRNWKAKLERNWSHAYCKPGSLSEKAIKSGWSIASLVRTLEGETFTVKASCFDASA